MKRVENGREFISKTRGGVYKSRVETELHSLAAKQLQTDTPLFPVKCFIPSNTQTDPISLMGGVMDATAYRAKLSELDRMSSLLQDGLTEEEVRITMKQNGNLGGFPRDPSLREEEQKTIQTKINKKLESLQQQSNNINSLTLSRHELMLEISATGDSNPLIHLIATDSAIHSDQQTVLLHDSLREIESRAKLHRKRQRSVNGVSHKKIEIVKGLEIESNSVDMIDSKMEKEGNVTTFETHQLTQTDASHVNSYRLTLAEIRQIPIFSCYSPGIPSNKLFIKNLHRNVSLNELASLFIKFQQDSVPKIRFRLLSGRMKGQAFVEFDSTELATEALHYVTGFILKGRPVIAVYATSNSSNT